MAQYAVFNECWQMPAKTEAHAFERLTTLGWSVSGYSYVAFPWATLFDFLQTETELPASLLEAYEATRRDARRLSKHSRLVTVCQHIYSARYTSILKSFNISLVYWSHATLDQRHIDGIEWRPFPLFPVQRYCGKRDGPLESWDKRSYRAGFVGVYDPAYYISSIREEIFKLESMGRRDLKIIRRKSWHYREDVYGCQIKGRQLDAKTLSRKNKESQEYRFILADSVFSLCPSGSGPNSIRLWESLSFGCVPVVFADDLALPGEIEDWLDSCLFLPETISADEILDVVDGQAKELHIGGKERVDALMRLNARYGVETFVTDIMELKSRGRRIVVPGEACVGAELAMKAANDQKNYRNAAEFAYVKTRVGAMKPSVVIVDPGLKGAGSHHHKINASVCAALGLSDVIVLANRSFSDHINPFEYSVIPTFTSSVYNDTPEMDSPEFLRMVRQMSRELSAELKKLNGLRAIYVHTPSPLVLDALQLSLGRLLSNDSNLKTVYLQLMFEPGAFGSGGEGNTTIRVQMRYRSALMAMKEICGLFEVELRIETSNFLFRDIFKNIMPDLDIGLHPHVFSCGLKTIKKVGEETANDGSRNVLLHCGDPRVGKGLEWIARCLMTWIKQTPEDIIFVIHAGVLRFPKSFPEIEEALVEIADIAEEEPVRVKLIRGYIDDNQWQGLLNGVSLITLLHFPDAYSHKTSGNFFDALECRGGSVPLLVTKGTVSSELLMLHRIHQNVIEYGDDDSFCELLQQEDTWNIVPNASRRGYGEFEDLFFKNNHADYVAQVLLGQAR